MRWLAHSCEIPTTVLKHIAKLRKAKGLEDPSPFEF